MLKSELGLLQQLVDGLTGQGAGGREYGLRPRLLKEIGQETLRLRKLWTEQLFSSVRDHSLTRYIQFHQAGLYVLLEQLSPGGLSPERPADENGASLLLDAREAIGGLLLFIKARFSRYFDQDLPLSVYEKAQQLTRIHQQQDVLNRLIGQSALDQDFGQMLATVLVNSIERAGSGSTSHRQMDSLVYWLEFLQQKLSAIPSVTSEALFLQLYQHNFNAPELFGWYASSLAGKSGETSAKAAVLLRQQQVEALRFVSVDTSRSFLPDWPPTNQLAPALLLPEEPRSAMSRSQKTVRDKGVSMPLTISVPQLGLFLRLCYLEGCFADHNISRLMRFFAGHFSTKMQADVSVKSLGRLFYTTDLTTAATLRNILQQMVLTINHTYFP